MLSQEKIATKKIGSIYEESRKNFNCLNYQYICSRLEAEFITLYKKAKLPKPNPTKREFELRNLRILHSVIHGARYKDVCRKEKLFSEAGVATIVKRTACKLSPMVKEEIELGGSPKRLIRNYAPHLLTRIEIRKKELENE